MKMRVGFEMLYDFPQPTPMIMVLGTHFSRASDVIVPDFLTTDPAVEITPYRDMFGNWCSRMVDPPAACALPPMASFATADFPIRFLLRRFSMRSRICPRTPWSIRSAAVIARPTGFRKSPRNLFANTAPGWARVQAICDFVHRHIGFGYEHARATRTAWEAYEEGKGVCRDYAHLAVAFCRCMQHSRALLYRVSQRHRHAKTLGRGRFRRLV